MCGIHNPIYILPKASLGGGSLNGTCGYLWGEEVEPGRSWQGSSSRSTLGSMWVQSRCESHTLMSCVFPQRQVTL